MRGRSVRGCSERLLAAFAGLTASWRFGCWRSDAGLTNLPPLPATGRGLPLAAVGRPARGIGPVTRWLSNRRLRSLRLRSLDRLLLPERLALFAERLLLLLFERFEFRPLAVLLALAVLPPRLWFVLVCAVCVLRGRKIVDLLKMILPSEVLFDRAGLFSCLAAGFAFFCECSAASAWSFDLALAATGFLAASLCAAELVLVALADVFAACDDGALPADCLLNIPLILASWSWSIEDMWFFTSIPKFFAISMTSLLSTCISLANS